MSFTGNWDVLGLRGTGSIDYTLDGVFVPKEFSYPALRDFLSVGPWRGARHGPPLASHRAGDMDAGYARCHDRRVNGQDDDVEVPVPHRAAGPGMTPLRLVAPLADLADAEEGGDPVCWAHLVCVECGAITTEGHRGGCSLGSPG